MLEIILTLAMTHCHAIKKRFIAVGYDQSKNLVIMCAGNHVRTIPKLRLNEIWLEEKKKELKDELGSTRSN